METFSKDTEILDLSRRELTHLPKEIAELKNLKVLFLSFNKFTKIPKIISQLQNLEFLGMKSCQVTDIDTDSLPVNIRWLTLTDNQIQKIPASIGKLHKLEKLLLAGNKIVDIPKEIIACKKLALLRISANNIREAPFPLIKKLPELAWYADAGNPFSFKESISSQSIPKISWNKITLNSLIGESAQNKIYLASIEGVSTNIAVKIFGNQVTSDGYPEDDLLISIMAGKHPHIIETLAEVTHLPSGKFASALKIVGNNFSNLGSPPSFQTCSRDTFSKDQKFSINSIIKILQGVSLAQTHLHSLGIMNGDLYAHNILINKEGYPYVGDFGAASLYDKDSEPERELIDIRAFGYLIEDLLDHCVEKEKAAYKRLEEIKKMCLLSNIEKRPKFKKVNLLLNNL